MGGRGASSGTSKAGNRYGSQYRTVVSSGNIKIIDAKHSDVETVVETMTRGRVYGILNSKGNLGSIVYFDDENKRSKRIDLDHIHKKMIPHTQHGYMTGGNDGKKGASSLTPNEKKMVERIRRLWENKKRGD